MLLLSKIRRIFDCEFVEKRNGFCMVGIYVILKKYIYLNYIENTDKIYIYLYHVETFNRS